MMMIKACKLAGFVYFWMRIIACNKISIANFSKAGKKQSNLTVDEKCIFVGSIKEKKYAEYTFKCQPSKIISEQRIHPRKNEKVNK